MKKLLLVIAIVAFGLTVNAQKNVIKANPLGLAFGVAELSYERVVSDNSSIEIGAAYSNFDVSSATQKVDASSFGVEGKYKFYFADNIPRGWYIAPVASYASSSVDSGGVKGDVSTFSAGALAGYQWVFGGGDSGFALDLNFGAQYVSASVDGNIASASIDGFLPRLGVSLGYAW